MSIILKDQGNRSELQQRIAAELREKQLGKSLVDANFDPPTDEIDPENHDYVKNLKPTTTLSWAWLVLGLMIVGTFVLIVVVTQGVELF